MACSVCPKCGKTIDIDGFACSGVPTLYWCECDSIFEMREFGTLYEVSREEVNLDGLNEIYENVKQQAKPDHCDFISNGLYIKKIRWINISKKELIYFVPEEDRKLILDAYKRV